MVVRRRLFRVYLVTVVGSLLVFTVAYDAGMTFFESRPRTFLEAFEVVMQTFTTTGYGQDAPWESPVMTFLVVGMQIASLLLIFAAFPIVIVPLVEDALSTSPPTGIDRADHVLICGSSSRTRTLLSDLDAQGVDGVVVEPDRERALDLHDQGHDVVHADPESVDALRDASVERATAVVADSDDEVDLSVIMAVGEVTADVPVYSVVEKPTLAPYHERAGATEAFSPRVLLGRGLANKVRNAVTTATGDNVDLGGGLEVAEFPIQPGSRLQGERISEVDIERQTGATLIGAWSNGEFRTPPFTDLVLDEHTVLLVIGTETALSGLKRRTLSEIRRYSRGEVIVVGFGVVGSTVDEVLAREDVPRTVVDLEERPGVDVVGDATDPGVLREAGVDEARTVILALDDDTTTLLATFVVREVNPDAEVIARADDVDNVKKLYRAGADYVLSLASVTGRLLASTILDEDVVSVDTQVEVVRLSAEPVAGQTIGDVELPPGVTVIAVEHRDGRISADVGDWTTLEATDELVVAGVDRDVGRIDLS
ncbi:potassium channel family protein [Salinigranum salinum]|uniref:potassium channel family protein n=1 Tax=Salinigranum salinum TaxID=1364937 RepID=UPI0012613AA6|nr:NAD-binding protein [Salinigranum salinum]